MKQVATYHNNYPAYSESQIFDMMEQYVVILAEKVSKQIDEYFEPYIRKTGVKGDITKGKLKWRGIKLHIYNGNNYRCYQLIQRGVKISPRLKVDCFGVVTYPI